MKEKNSKENFEKEIEILKNQLQPEEVYLLGFLKGFTRNDLKLMMQSGMVPYY